MEAAARLPIDWYPVDSLMFATTTVSVELTSRETRLFGWSFIETTGTAGAVIELREGGNDAGNLIVAIALNGGESTRDWLGLPGIRCRSGVRLVVVSGSVRGSIWPLLLNDAEILDQYRRMSGE